jgi:hypothetical protein
MVGASLIRKTVAVLSSGGLRSVAPRRLDAVVIGLPVEIQIRSALLVAFHFILIAGWLFVRKIFSMVRTRIASADLLWIFREKLSSIDDRFKTAPIAIIPSGNGWEAITSRRYRNSQPRVAKCIEQIQAELRSVYRLSQD